MDAVEWLRAEFAEWEFTGRGVLVSPPSGVTWPLHAESYDELVGLLAERGMLADLPDESAALANIIEGQTKVHAVLALERLRDAGEDVWWTVGGARGYPDLEVGGAFFSDTDAHDEVHAVDVKVARVSASGTRTQNAITLYTGNTFFRYPTLHWSGTFRPFGDYRSHLDLVVLYRMDGDVRHRVTEAEVIVHPGWRLASRNRSSGTREYIGAVGQVQRLRDGDGEFETAEEFYSYWRNYGFRLSRTAERELRRLTSEQGGG
jgi:hypothetical protein